MKAVLFLLKEVLSPCGCTWRSSWASTTSCAGTGRGRWWATSRTSSSSSRAVTRALGTSWPGSWTCEAWGSCLGVWRSRGPSSWGTRRQTGCRRWSWTSPRQRASLRQLSGWRSVWGTEVWPGGVCPLDKLLCLQCFRISKNLARWKVLGIKVRIYLGHVLLHEDPKIHYHSWSKWTYLGLA